MEARMVNASIEFNTVFLRLKKSPATAAGPIDIESMHNSIFKRILAGTFRFDPAVHLQPRSPGLGAVFPPGRIAALRRKLLLAGIEPESAGLPPASDAPFQRIGALRKHPQKQGPVKESKEAKYPLII